MLALDDTVSHSLQYDHSHVGLGQWDSHRGEIPVR